MLGIFVLSLASVVLGGPATETYKDQYCTDPRTMRKHKAYSEWADAYSCTRHRCQPGGRNLAIYTVGCKRVEAPESAIECEEVVEDTNMQFPYCCTRLRCLVLVRGEVWTRVLGQPWEALPAAPWSHMYKMKRPPPADGSFIPKTAADAVKSGPVYELAEPEAQKVLRAALGKTTEAPDYNQAVPRAAPAPDIVIALTNSEQKEDRKKNEKIRHKRVRKTPPTALPFYDDSEHDPDAAMEMDEPAPSTEKPSGIASSDERFFANPYGVTQKVPFKSQHHQVSWTEIPQNQWNEHDPGTDTDANKDGTYHQPDFPSASKDPPPSNLQALVDAIGTRMRDIESVVQRMSEKVHDATPQDLSAEKRTPSDGEVPKHHKTENKDNEAKKPSPDAEHYKRFSVRNRSKYLHNADGTTEPSSFAEDTHMNGYFSDASNSVLRRSNGPKEPVQIYMAPVENKRKHNQDSSEDVEKKHKKHSHKKKKNKHGRKKHHGKEEKRKRFNRISSAEIDKNVVSLEDSGAVNL